MNMEQTTGGNCPTCTKGDLITIVMSMNDQDVSFTTCHFCESKWWYQDGELVPLNSVLDLVATNPTASPTRSR